MADVEDVKFALKDALLSAQFTAVIDEVYATKVKELEADRPIDKMVPTEIYISTKYVPQVLPCVEISVVQSRSLSNDGFPHLRHDAGIFFHVRGDDEEIIELQVARYLISIRRYFLQYPYLAGLASQPVLIGDDSYAPFVPLNEYQARPFIKSGLVTVYVTTIG